MSVRATEGHVLIEVGGVIDVRTARDVREWIIQRGGELPGDVVLDLSRIRFLDSVGIEALSAACWNLRTINRRIAIVCPAATPRMMLVRSGLGLLFPVLDSLASTSAVEPGKSSALSSRRPRSARRGGGFHDHRPLTSREGRCHDPPHPLQLPWWVRMWTGLATRLARLIAFGPLRSAAPTALLRLQAHVTAVRSPNQRLSRLPVLVPIPRKFS
jgi:anti-sigma B factor antagonist